MGTLFDQRQRWEHVPSLSKSTEEIISLMGYESFDDFSAIESIQIVELAIRNMEIVSRVNDYDAKDEQLAGFGKLFERAVEALELKIQ